MTWLAKMWRTRRWMLIGVAVAVVAGGSLLAAKLARSTPAVPMAEVSSGEFVDYLQLRGNLKALKSVVLAAPSFAGELQIIKLAKNGSSVKKGEDVAQFDTSQLELRLLQQRTELRQAESEIQRVRAQGNMQIQQVETELQQSRYNVERAKLEVGRQEVLSQIEGEKAKLDLATAEKRYLEIQKKLESEKTKSAADVASQMHRRDKSANDVAEAENRIAALTLKAPVDGMVNVMPNWRARQGFFGGSAPEFKEGDRAWSGAGILELPDMSEIRVVARIEETDRGRLHLGQKATVRVDAIPEREFAGQVVAISPLTKPDFSSWPPLRNFDIEVQLTEADPRLRPGMSATPRVAVDRIADAVMITAESVFQKGGRTVVYVLKGGQFEEREIVIARRSGTQIAVASGLKAGERVTRVDPTIQEQAKAAEEKK